MTVKIYTDQELDELNIKVARLFGECFQSESGQADIIVDPLTCEPWLLIEYTKGQGYGAETAIHYTEFITLPEFSTTWDAASRLYIKYDWEIYNENHGWVVKLPFYDNVKFSGPLLPVQICRAFLFEAGQESLLNDSI